jgi:hypothetical protein
VGKPEGRITSGKPRRKLEDNIKIDFKNWDGGMNWIHLTQDRDRRRTIANAEKTFGFHKMRRIS